VARRRQRNEPRFPSKTCCAATGRTVSVPCSKSQPIWYWAPASPPRVRSYCRFVLPHIPFIPDSLTYSVPLFLKRQCDRTLFPPSASVRRQPAAAGSFGFAASSHAQLSASPPA
jgi:hypothetical protein